MRAATGRPAAAGYENRTTRFHRARCVFPRTGSTITEPGRPMSGDYAVTLSSRIDTRQPPQGRRGPVFSGGPVPPNVLRRQMSTDIERQPASVDTIFLVDDVSVR